MYVFVCVFLLPLIIANIFTPIHLYNYVDLHVCNESLDKYSTVMRHLIDFSVISDWISFNFAVPYWTCGQVYTYWNECVITTSKMMMMMMKKKQQLKKLRFIFHFDCYLPTDDLSEIRQCVAALFHRPFVALIDQLSQFNFCHRRPHRHRHYCCLWRCLCCCSFCCWCCCSVSLLN